MYDILPDESTHWQRVEQRIHEIAALFNYHEIRLPLIEHTELFSRGIGEETDVVNKEMYTFPDRRGRSLTLRPELTASVIRSYLEHGLHNTDPFQKLYYIGPMFRYEKPQRGRSRQFHQYGIEAVGSLAPELDVEVIHFAWALMDSFGIRGLSLRINSIGCAKDHRRYQDALRDHFSSRIKDMCPDCQRRYNDNPLRILDCKNPQCQPHIDAAPASVDLLCQDCANHFERVCQHLDELGLSYQIDSRLVRGLDYYTRTVFELISTELGAQDALLGGGHYDGLVEQLGGPPTPGVGFAGGMERLILVLRQRNRGPQDKQRLDLFLATIGEEGLRLAIRLMRELRAHGVSVDTDYRGRSLSKQIGYADQLAARYLLVLGPDEVSAKTGKIKQMDSGEELPVTINPTGLRSIINRR
jgi:histidyl-tRNA synthetase